MVVYTIVEINKLNNDVCRIFCTKDVFFDMSLKLLPVSKNDKIVLEPCRERDDGYDVVLKGTMYGEEDNFIAVSFGGLIARLPKTLTNDPIVIGIKKNKKRELVRGSDASKTKQQKTSA